MIIKSVGGRRKPNISATAAARNRIPHTLRYITRDSEKSGAIPEDHDGQPLRFSNLAATEVTGIATEMEAWKTLRPSITDPVRHVILSPEKDDRPLTRAEWQTSIDIFREERGLGDAPYLAEVHTDGHDGRHAQHLHLVFLRLRSDGSAVPDAWDSSVHRAASRKIEERLGLLVNAGAQESQKFSGRNRYSNRDRSGERQGLTPERIHVDPAAVQSAISNATSIKSLRENLQAEGIEMRTRRHNDGQVYAWSLRNLDGPKEWTSGSKLAPGGDLGWAKVSAQLDANRDNHTPDRDAESAPSRRWPARLRGPNLAADQRRPPRRLSEATAQSVLEGFEILKQLLALGARRPAPVHHPARIELTPAPPPRPQPRPAADTPQAQQVAMQHRAAQQQQAQRARPASQPKG